MGSGRSRGLLLISTAMLGIAGACQCVDLSGATFDEDGASGAPDARPPDAGARDVGTPDVGQPEPEDATVVPGDAAGAGPDARTLLDGGLVSRDATTEALCNINSESFAAGALNPVNDCQACDPANLYWDWSNRAAGAPCGSPPAVCTLGNCDGSGTCVPKSNGISCSVGPAAGYCSAGVCTIATTQLTLYPEADATIDQGDPGTNYGTQTSLVVSTSQSTVLRFGLGVWPCAGRYVSKAILRLHGLGAGSMSASAWRLVKGFTESQVTWHEAASGIAWEKDGATGAGDRVAFNAQGPVMLNCTIGPAVVDVTGAVQAWADDRMSNEGLLLEQAAYTLEVCTFTSKDGQEWAQRPVIEIDYY
jgi:hypothetical protein